MIGFLCYFSISLNCSDCTTLTNNTNLYNNPSGISIFDFEDCIFHRIESYLNMGGVMYLSSGTSASFKLCSFLNCSTFEHGGALYIYLNNGNITFDKVCAYKCHCRKVDKRGQFSYNTAKYYDISLFTMSSCGHVLGYGTHSFSNAGGDQMIKFYNSSNNLGFKFSGIHIESSKNVNLTYCNFYNNHVSAHVIIHFYNGGNFPREFSYSNIINNSRITISERDGIIHSYNCPILILKCMFSKNIGNLFTTTSSQITVNECNIDHNSTNIEDGDITLQTNNIYQIPSTYSISVFQTGSCYDFLIDDSNKNNPEILPNQFPWIILILITLFLIIIGFLIFWYFIYIKNENSSDKNLENKVEE